MAGATEVPTSSQSGSLARTGLAPWVLTLVAVGIALVIAGAMLLLISRRRRGEVR